MITHSYDDPDYVRQWVSWGIFSRSDGFDENTAVISFRNDKGALVAGVMFHDYMPDHRTIQLSAYSNNKRWLNRSNLQVIFGYVFDGCSLRLACAQCSEKNVQARKLWASLGANEYELPDMWGDGVSMIVHTLSRKQWQNSKFAVKRNG